MSAVTFEPVYHSIGFVLLLGLVAGAVLYSVSIASNGLTGKQLRQLLSLRGAALLLLILALLRPALIRTDTQPSAATLTVLADTSRSMTLTDGEGGTRWEAQRKVLERIEPRLSAIDEQLDVQWYSYGEGVTSRSGEPVGSWINNPPTEPRTDIGTALRAAISGAAGQPLAGVILIGDGATTEVDNNPALVARTLSALDVPLWTIPIGPRNSDEQSRDVAVEELADSFRVFARNLFRVQATIRTRGMVGRELPIEVALIDSQERRQVIATRSVAAATADDALPIDVEITAPAPGSYRLEVSTATQPGEVLTDNNVQLAFLDVREGGGRILYLEGELRLEQVYLRRAINESPDLSLTFQPITERTQGQWPIDLGMAVTPGQFDVYIIGDLDAAALGEKNLQGIANAVNAGSGLLMIGGQHTFDLGGYAGTPLAELLPIRLDPAKRIALQKPPPATAMIPAPVPLQPRRLHPITQLIPNGDNRAAWQSLRPLMGANRFTEVKQSPTVDVLLESPAKEPILVTGLYGNGRTATFAGDTTWKWWLQGRQESHKRFWRQLLLWLLARDTRESGSVWVRMDARRFDRQEPASFEAGIQLVEAADAVPLQAEVIDRSGTRIPIPETTTIAPPAADANNNTIAGDAPTLTGKLPDLPGGLYRLRVAPQNSDSPVKAAEMFFQVVDVDVELSRPLAEVARMEQWAAVTESAGGASYRPDEVDQLLDRLEQLRQRAELPVVERYRLGDDPFSGWLLMTLLVGLLSTEWFLRRRWHLG